VLQKKVDNESSIYKGAKLSTDVTFYTNNGDFFGGNTLEQNPLYSAQVYVSYDFCPECGRR